ncbi:MOSC domain-containing protein [Pseudonocardia phyllosphaerae]|uniref:MOSC domain-containing protein n=1 Tax=Pseudonocardia phyllosphaerae TaxID=3390502 RepID=UPI00397AC963
MKISSLYRYPVKSMLGETLGALELDDHGVVGDRALALVDAEAGRIASAKQPRHWRALLTCRSRVDDGAVTVTLPDGRTLTADSGSEVEQALSALLGRAVTLSARRNDGAVLERPEPDEVLAEGLDAEVDAPLLEMAAGAPGGRFVDHSPVHLITTATLDALGVDALRYRPNVVVETPEGTPPFVENDWMSRPLTLGAATIVPTLPTPRCVLPTLEQGDLPRDPSALHGPARRNRVPVEGFGDLLPCAGLYARVETPGAVRVGDVVTLG